LLPLFFVQRYNSTELEVSLAFGFGENRKHGTNGWTDRRTDGQRRTEGQKSRVFWMWFT